jgi:hypothetical protein
MAEEKMMFTHTVWSYDDNGDPICPVWGLNAAPCIYTCTTTQYAKCKTGLPKSDKPRFCRLASTKERIVPVCPHESSKAADTITKEHCQACIEEYCI